MITLHTFDNTCSEGSLYRQFLQSGNQTLMQSEALAALDNLGEFLDGLAVEANIENEELDPGFIDNPRLWEDELKVLKEAGDIAGYLKLIEDFVMLDDSHSAFTDASQTEYGEWTYDAKVLVEPTLRELQENVWASDPLHDRREWKGEVHRDETHLGYWEWVEHQREVDDTSLVIRNANNGLFWSNEDGWAGFATAERFVGSDRYQMCLPLEGEWVSEVDALPWKIGDTVVWTDPDDGICTRTGVLAAIFLISPGEVHILFEDEWSAEVNVSELSHNDAG